MPVSEIAFDEWAGWISELDELRAQRDDLDARIEKVAEVIQAHMGDHTDATIDDTVVYTWRWVERTTVDVKSLRRVIPEVVLAPFEVTRASRVFRRVPR
jgi:hypothetical protein